MRKIFVSGFFDQLNVGHLSFLEAASNLGQLYVGVGSDENQLLLKGHKPVVGQKERLKLIQALECVTDAFATTGTGLLDFEAELNNLQPDIFAVASKHDQEKLREWSQNKALEVQVLDLPKVHFGSRTEGFYFPSRLCLTGGWLDQPWVSEVFPGAVTTLNLEPIHDYAFRSGMATSTREAAKRIWSTFPTGDPEHLAKIVFGAENPPGKLPIAGSQDALGLLMPGFNVLHYNGSFWPTQIESSVEHEVARWFESVLFMIPIQPRPDGYDPLIEKHLTEENIRPLAESSEMAIRAVAERDPALLGKAMRQTLESWRKLMPNTVPPSIYEQVLATDGTCYGCTLSGCGGGYLLIVADQRPEGALSIKVRTS